MLIKMKIPSPGESISEVEIAEWLVNDGDYVEKDQTIAEIDSDKATLELPAEESGSIKILIPDGSTVAVGDVVCIIDTKSQNDNSKSKEKEEHLSREVINQVQNEEKVTPLASAIIEKHEITKDQLKGLAEAKKIRKEDVLNILKDNNINKSRRNTKNKMSTLRRKIATRLVKVKNETAMLTTFNEIDMTEIMKIRKEYKDRFKSKYEVNLGFMSFFTSAVTKSLLEFKDVNAMIDKEHIIHHDYCDVGIAVSAPKGLMVPVLRNAELMNFQEIELEIKRLAIKAREGKISIDEMLGGTFTITNGGVFGSMLSTPIINPPQSAILGMHNIIERAVVVNEKIEIRSMMYVALSYDHRIIDGRESVGFLCRVKECLENPIIHLFNDNVDKHLDL